VKAVTDTQDRDQQILSRLAKIEHKVDSIDQTSAFALRADEAKHLASVEKIFRKSKRRAQVYLAANGSRSVEEIAEHLGMKSPHVSRDLTALGSEGLLGLAESVGHRNIWSKKALDHTVRISRYLQKKFILASDGTPDTKKKKRRRR